jgi:hypothetical protein
MNFCSNCGTKQNVDAKFCPNCGQAKNGAQQSSAPFQNSTTTQTVSAQEHSAPTGEHKKELIKLSNSIFYCFVPILMLMSKQAEGGFASLAADYGDEKFTAFIAMMVVLVVFIGVIYFTVRIQGVNKGKPGWVLGTLITLSAMTVINWTMTNFSNFNWADWASEIIGLAQLFLIYATYQMLNTTQNK